MSRKKLWRLLTSKHPRILVGGSVLLTVIILAISAPLLAPHSPIEQNLRLSLRNRTEGYPLGTDEFGRCIFSRILYGARISLQVGVVAVGIGAFIGGLIGLMAGVYGGVLESVLMRLMDVMLAIPGILLAIAIVAALGPGMLNVMLAVGISSVPSYARLVRGSVLSVREKEYVEAAQAVGAPTGHVARRHILPNVMAPVLVVASMQMGSAILAAAGLSFIGLGAQAPTPEWGAMLSRGREFLRIAPHVATYPGLAIFITVMGFNFFGDGLRDLLDPRLKT
ncbi:MAG: nickel transporter permease [Bacillota bacterium]